MVDEDMNGGMGVVYFAINIVLIIWIFGKLLYFNFNTNINTPPFRWRIHKKSVQAMLATGAIMSGIFAITDIQWIWFVFGVIFDIVLFSDTLYMRYYKNPLTISVVIHQAKLIKGIRKSVFGVFLSKDFLYFVDIPVLYLVAVVLIKNPVPIALRIIYSVICIIGGTLWFSYIYHHSNRKSYFWNKKRIARDLGVIYYHVDDLVSYVKNSLRRKKGLSPEERARVEATSWKRSLNQYSKIAKDKNLVVIQMESMQEFLLNRKIEGQEITPNLNRLSAESVSFTNMYYQTSVGNTSDAELILNNSLYPLADKPACYECQNNTFHSLGHAAKEKGYQNFGFHGNQASFWNRHLMYRLYGYDSFIDNSMLDNDEFIFPGLSDHSFFRQIAKFLEEKSKLGRFFAFLITLSLHHPYDFFEKNDFPVGELEGTFLGKYIKGAHYADKAIGEFMQDLKEKGLYDSSLIVMYGDHSGIPRQYRQEMMDYLQIENNDFNWLQYQKVVALMHLPGQKEGVRINKIVGQIDILPTIANLMDLEIGYALGNDILDDNYLGGVIIREGIVIADDYIYFPNKEQALHIPTGKRIELTSKMKEEIKVLQNKLEISDIILERNAFKG